MLFKGITTDQKYDYVNAKSDLSVVVDQEAVTSMTGIVQSSTRDVDFIVCRHGNALHNKPVEIHTLDSPLTVLGMKQAKEAGDAINAYYKDKYPGKIINIIPVASYLNRSQHTALIITNCITGFSNGS